MYNGFFKYGLRNSVSSKAGLQYSYTYSYSNCTWGLLWLKNKLYVRNNTEADKPFIMYDTRTLIQKTDDSEFNHKVTANARNEGNHINDRILEKTNNTLFNEALKSTDVDYIRKLDETPLFTDGELIYVISSHVPVHSKTKDLDTEWEVEAYDPSTWKCKFCKRLIMKPEEQKEWSAEKAAKVIEDTESAKYILPPSQIMLNTYATNGKVLAIASATRIYFFDLETGIRLPETLQLSSSVKGYSYITNSFYSFNRNDGKLIISSFKIDGFKTKAELDNEGTLSFSELMLKRTKSVIEEQKDSNRAPARSMVNILKSLGSSTQKKFDQIIHNKDTSLSNYLI